MRSILAAALAIALAALATVPSVQADPLHVYADAKGEDRRVGVQEHATPVAVGAWAETDSQGVELHARLFFTHCIAEVGFDGSFDGIVCAV